MQVPAGKPGPLDRAEEARRIAAGDPADVAAIVPCFRDPDPLVRGTVAGVLFLRLRPGEIGTVLDELERRGVGGDELDLLRAEQGARSRDPEGGRLACELAVTASDPAIRSRAARGCVLAGRPGDDVVRRLAADDDWQVRTRLAVALREAREERGDLPAAWREVLERLAADPHPTVARAAAAGGTGRGT